MILLRPRERSDRPRLVLLFGAGLIGTAVAEQLESQGQLRPEILPLSWSDPSLQARQLADIEDRASRAWEESCERRAPVPFTVVWSAGRAGFDATREDTAPELASFHAVVRLTRRLRERLCMPVAQFILFSSAGGLFEGQRQVDAQSIPAPRRPYGYLKVAQEELLPSGDPEISAKIFRLATVYGRIRKGQRVGLISTLLLNGIFERVSFIVGTMNTLRDFIWAEDVGCYAASAILGGSQPGGVALLASARPASIFEIRKIIEDVIGRRLFIAHVREPWNREDITFARSALPPTWSSSDLRTNIAIAYADAIGDGVLRSWFRGAARRSTTK